MTRAENEALLGTHFTLSKRVHQFGRDKLGSERKRFSKVTLTLTLPLTLPLPLTLTLTLTKELTQSTAV